MNAWTANPAAPRSRRPQDRKSTTDGDETVARTPREPLPELHSARVGVVSTLNT